METRANYLIIALFTLGVVVSAFLFVLWFSGAENGPKRRMVTIAFEDSIAGLAKGSAVDFNGIRVGDVTRIYFDAKDTSEAYAEVAIDWATPVRADTQAGLNVGTLSGSGRISLRGGSPDAPELTGANPVIHAQPSGLAAVLETSKGLSAKAEAIRTQLNDVVAENRDSLAAIAKNTGSVMDLFNGNSSGARKAAAAMSEAGPRFAALEPKLSQASERISAVWRAVDPSSLAVIRENGAVVMDTLRANSERIEEIRRNAGSLSSRVGELTPKLDRSLDRGRTVVAAVDQAKITHAMDNIDVVRASLDASQGDLDAAQRNLSVMSDKMGRVSERFGRVRQAAADFIASDDTSNAFKAVGLAIQSVRRTSNRLSTHVQAISTAISRFKSTSSREMSTLGSDTRHMMNEVDRTGRDIKANPSSVIFGNTPSSLPTYGGP